MGVDVRLTGHGSGVWLVVSDGLRFDVGVWDGLCGGLVVWSTGLGSVAVWLLATVWPAWDGGSKARSGEDDSKVLRLDDFVWLKKLGCLSPRVERVYRAS